MERRAVVFFGRVQGVGFRATTRGVARGRRVTGWVRNEPDGSVRAEIQGEPAEIDACLDELRRRMSRRIDRETAHAVPLEASETGFSVQH
jgi:acylphosphatase